MRWDESKCWSCKKSAGRCSWSAMLAPVAGWKVEKRPVPPGTHMQCDELIKVRSCPEYEKDESFCEPTRNRALRLNASATKKPVGEYTLDGQLVKIHESLAAAATAWHCSDVTVRNACLGKKTRLLANRIWRFEK